VIPEFFLIRVFLVAWSATVVTRAAPGLLTLAATRVFHTSGTRATASFLAGALLVDVLIASAVVVGWHVTSAAVLFPVPVRLLVLGTVLCIVGVGVWRSRGAKAQRANGDEPRHAHGWVLAGVAVTATAPGTWNWWVTIGLTLFATSAAHGHAPTVAAGIIVGAATWWSLLVFLLHRGRRLGLRLSPTVRKAFAVVLLAVGGGLLGRAIWLLLA